MAETEKVAEKKVVITDLNEALKEFDNHDDLKAAIAAGLVKAEIDEVKIESGQFSGDYVRLSLGDKAVDEASIVAALVAIAGGNLTPPKKKDSDEFDDRSPSLVKFALYGADLSARSRTSQRIKAAAEGPEKGIEQMAKIIMKNKPGTSLESARQMARAVMED